MDKLKHFWTLLFATSALCACAPSDPEAGDEVRIVGDKSFTVEAEDTAVNGGAPIAFVTTGEWSASPVGDAKEWLIVTPESGPAGAGEITIACQPNTGSQRDGKVRIVCGEGAAEIAIHQNGAGGDEPDPGPGPVTPHRGQVSRIVYETISESGDFGDFKEDWICDFSYDEEDRISVVNIEGAVVEEEHGGWTYKENYRFDRSELSKITLINTFNEDGGEDWVETCYLTLDAVGRVSRCDMDGDGSNFAIVSYDAAGRLSNIIEEGDGFREEWQYVWDGGLLATITAEGSYYQSGFEDFTGRYGDLPNGAMNIDPNLFLMYERPNNPLGITWLLRMMGASSDRLIAVVDLSQEQPLIPSPGSLPKPNMTEHCSTEVSYEYYHPNLHYDADPDGLVRSITKYRADVVALVEYDIVSGDELVDPEHPESGYRISDMSDPQITIISTQKNGVSEVLRFEYCAN